MIVVRDTSQRSYLMSRMLLETIRINDGTIYNLSYHQQRVTKSILELYHTQTNINLKDIITPPPDGLYRCRILYNTSVQNIEYIPYTPKDIQTLQIIEAPNFEYAYKYANRDELNQLLATSHCDDVIITQNGYITDTTISNIALLKDDVWYTPKNPLLQGTTRAFLLDNYRLKETDIKAQDLAHFDKIALMNAMIGFYVIDKEIKDIICN